MIILYLNMSKKDNIMNTIVPNKYKLNDKIIN